MTSQTLTRKKRGDKVPVLNAMSFVVIKHATLLLAGPRALFKAFVLPLLSRVTSCLIDF